MQRCYTIFEFLSNPTQFFDPNIIEKTVPKQVASILGYGGNDEPSLEICKYFKELLIKWVKEKHQTMEDVEGMQFCKFWWFFKKRRR